LSTRVEQRADIGHRPSAVMPSKEIEQERRRDARADVEQRPRSPDMA
jgi:hypothetical protein